MTRPTPGRCRRPRVAAGALVRGFGPPIVRREAGPDRVGAQVQTGSRTDRRGCTTGTVGVVRRHARRAPTSRAGAAARDGCPAKLRGSPRPARVHGKVVRRTALGRTSTSRAGDRQTSHGLACCGGLEPKPFPVNREPDGTWAAIQQSRTGARRAIVHPTGAPDFRLPSKPIYDLRIREARRLPRGLECGSRGKGLDRRTRGKGRRGPRRSAMAPVVRCWRSRRVTCARERPATSTRNRLDADPCRPRKEKPRDE